MSGRKRDVERKFSEKNKNLRNRKRIIYIWKCLKSVSGSLRKREREREREVLDTNP